MQKMLFIGILICFVSCVNEKAGGKLELRKLPSKDGVEVILFNMYAGDREHRNPLANTLLFSKEMVELNRICDSLIKVDIQRIRNSDTPNEKPVLREGSSISSFYEGVTDFEINEIVIKGDDVHVVVTLSNRFYQDQLPWEERIVLIEEDGLKIDDIFFDINLTGDEPSLKERVRKFLGQKIVE
jgi:hypothetical protein